MSVAGHRAALIERIQHLLDQARDHYPGEWCRIMVYQSKSAAHAARARITKRTTGFEAKAAQLPEGRSGVWVRYVGDEAKPKVADTRKAGGE